MTLFRRARPIPVTTPAMDHINNLESWQHRTYTAEDATRAMATRLDAAVRREQTATADLAKVTADRDGFRDQARHLGAEVAALRHLLDRAQTLARSLTPRGQYPQLCPVCHDPMPVGMDHHCPRTSTYTEEVAAA